MAEHPNVEQVRRGYDAFQRGDADVLRQVFADDVVWHNFGRNPFAGDHKGTDAVLEMFGRLGQETGGTLKLDVIDVLANDDHTVGFYRATAERNGKKLDARFLQVFHLDGDRRVTEVWNFPDDTVTVDAFWQ